jgi:hypothetical protein
MTDDVTRLVLLANVASMPVCWIFLAIMEEP